MGDNKVEKLKYSTSGVLINRIIDVSYGDKLIRSRGLETIYIENNKVIKTSNLISLKPIEKYKVKDKSWLANTNIGVIDLETYLNNNNIHQVYALGFRTNLASEPVVYYIDDSFDSRTLVLSMIDELLSSKYSNITFYCHNLGGYDVVFLLKILYNYNESIVDNDLKYKIFPLLRDNKIIKLTIKKGKYSLTILDSYCILTNNLNDLCKDFGIEIRKSVFPYKFSTQNYLNYKGHTPAIHFYNDLSLDDYNKIYTEDWSFKDETIKYLINDLNCLFQIITSANNQIYNDYKLNIMESVTIYFQSF